MMQIIQNEIYILSVVIYIFWAYIPYILVNDIVTSYKKEELNFGSWAGVRKKDNKWLYISWLIVYGLSIMMILHLYIRIFIYNLVQFII